MDTMISGSLPWNDGGGPKDDSPYADLAAAIVLQAVKDYIRAIRKMWDKKASEKKRRETIIEKQEIEKFFFSEWYEFLCNIDPKKVINQCRRRAIEQEKQAIMKRNRAKVKKLRKAADNNNHK